MQITRKLYQHFQHHAKAIVFIAVFFLLLDLVGRFLDIAFFNSLAFNLLESCLVLLTLVALYRNGIGWTRQSRALADNLAQSERDKHALSSTTSALRLLINQLPIGVVVHGPNGEILLSNEMASELLEMSAHDFRRHRAQDDIWSVIYEDGRPCPPEERPALKVLKDGQSVRDQVLGVLRQRSQERIWLSVSASPIWGEDGRVQEVIVGFVDVSARKRAEDMLHERTSLLQSIIETSVAAIIVVSPEGQITFANKSAEQILGLKRNEIESRRYDTPDWKHTDYDGNPWPDEKQPFVRVMHSGEPVFDVRHAIEWPNGQRVYLSINGAPIKDEQGRITNTVFLVSDMTQNYLAERALRESEERFQQIADTISDIVYMLDAQTRAFIYVNRAFEMVFGIPVQTILEDSDAYLACVHPDDRPMLIRRNAQMWETLTEMSLEYRIINRKGEMRWLSTTTYPVHDAKGVVYRFVGTSTDITAYRLIEHSLQQSEELLRAVMRNLPVNLFVIDNAGIIQFSGGQLQERIRGDAPEPNGKSLRELYADSAPQLMSDMERVLNGETIIREREYEGYSYMTYFLPMRDEKENIIGGIGVGFDITVQKLAEKQRIELALKNERIELLTQFISDISHDLKTPLSIINTSLYLMERYDNPADQQRKLETIKMQARLLEKIIQDILVISRLEHVPSLSLNPIDLNDMAHDIVHKLRPTIEKKRQKISVVTSPKSLYIMGDRDELYRALVNIVENAVNYTPEEGQIAIEIATEETQAIFSVQDNGIGISAEDLPMIFARFYRADKARTFSGGTGLGLAIADKIVRMHGGAIHVESAIGKGSLFRVYLPHR